MWAMVWGKLQKCNSEALNFYTLTEQLEEKLPKKDLEVWGDGVMVHLECKESFPF